MRSIAFKATALVASLVVIAVVGCGEKLTAPSAPPANVLQKEASDLRANQLLSKATHEEPHWPGDVQWTEAETAVDSLGRVGPAALPALVELLHGQDERLRVGAARAIAIMGPAAKDAVPDLIAALSDQSSRVRKNVLRALGQIGSAADSAVDAIAREARRPESPLDKEIERERNPPPKPMSRGLPLPPTSAPADAP